MNKIQRFLRFTKYFKHSLNDLEDNLSVSDGKRLFDMIEQIIDRSFIPSRQTQIITNMERDYYQELFNLFFISGEPTFDCELSNYVDMLSYEDMSHLVGINKFLVLVEWLINDDGALYFHRVHRVHKITYPNGTPGEYKHMAYCFSDKQNLEFGKSDSFIVGNYDKLLEILKEILNNMNWDALYFNQDCAFEHFFEEKKK